MKLKRKLLIMIMINILLLQNLINYQQNIFAARLAQANLTSKNDIAGLVKQTNFEKKLKNVNKKVTSTKPKNLLVKNEFKKKYYSSSLFISQSYFNIDRAQLYLML